MGSRIRDGTRGPGLKDRGRNARTWAQGKGRTEREDLGSRARDKIKKVPGTRGLV